MSVNWLLGYRFFHKVLLFTWKGEREQKTTWSVFVGNCDAIVFVFVLRIIQALFRSLSRVCFSLAVASSILEASKRKPFVIGELEQIKSNIPWSFLVLNVICSFQLFSQSIWFAAMNFASFAKSLLICICIEYVTNNTITITK